MGFNVPIINRDSDWCREWFDTHIKEPKMQKRLVLIIVSIALLLDNMLYMVIVPIIPKYLRDIHAYDVEFIGYHNETSRLANGTKLIKMTGGEIDYLHEETELGFLFASKALVQIMVNPFSGAIIDRIGYELPMIIGLVVMFSSTAIFALGQSYGVLFFARSLQGLGSAFADTSGLAMIADRFTEENERSVALGIALAFISFGSLVAPPFGSVLYAIAGKPVPFMILSLICLIDGFMVFMVIQPKEKNRVDEKGDTVKGTPIYRLFMDPFIAVCSGALIMANVSLAFLEPTITTWMTHQMPETPDWLVGMIWFPAFFPHVFGVYATIKLMKRFPQYPWLLAACGLGMEGLACFVVPYTTSVLQLILPLSIICFGIALVDTSLLPMLGHLVDTRHTSVYGSVYAIADISYSLAYAFGPIIAGSIVAGMSFFALNIIICVSNVIYVPVLAMLRKVYAYKQFENEMHTLKDDYDTVDGDGYPRSVVNNDYQGYGTVDGENGYQTSAFNQPNFKYQQDFPQPEYPAGQRPRDEKTYQVRDNDPLNPQW